MWKTKDYDKNDGLTPLLELFKSKDEFIMHYIEASRFFSQEIVEKQLEKMQTMIDNEEKIPVRFSKKNKSLFYHINDQNKESKRTFKTKEDASKFIANSNTPLVHKETGLPVLIDKDGNYYVRKEIVDYTGLKVSQGANSNIKNTMISHIWGETANPLFFTALWNIVITPYYLSFILDKPDTSGDLVKRIKGVFKAICYELYLSKKPEYLSKHTEQMIVELEEYSELAKKLIRDNKITFIPYKKDKDESSNIDIRDITEALYKDEDIKQNKDFIFSLLDKLQDSGIDYINIFLDRKKTFDICKMSYPILVDITNCNKREREKKKRPVKSDVYYSTTYKLKDKEYYVCNDWKINNKELIIEWLTDSRTEDGL